MSCTCGSTSSACRGHKRYHEDEASVSYRHVVIISLKYRDMVIIRFDNIVSGCVDIYIYIYIYISTHPLTILSNLKKFKDLFIFHFQDNDNIYALMDVSCLLYYHTKPGTSWIQHAISF